jgi:hypothetical protein
LFIFQDAAWMFVADYTHAELEGDEIGTEFFNNAGEGRLELNHEPWVWRGAALP